MPIDTELAGKTWYRYAWARDNGHTDFIDKADKCDRFFRGDQWDSLDKLQLDNVRRPALTINKIISTLATVMGEQIYNRSEIAFRPRDGSSSETADVLTKVFKQISDNNQLDWQRSDMFADGVITSRGFLDVRLDFTDSMRGEVAITKLNPKNVIVDPDAEDYDPDKWGEVFVTKWMTPDDIAVLYNKEDADHLRGLDSSFFPYGYDSIEAHRDRFGDRDNPIYGGSYDDQNVLRNIRVIDRQHRVLDKQRHFVDPMTGDMRPIPETWDRNRIAYVREQFGLEVIPKLVRRIRWTVIADSVVLHDDWSPYNHLTVVPYFPYFRHGKTIGLVENLLGPQELLNKVSSQELHVVNTTANSGWKIKRGGLLNMSIEELEQRGAQTGIVLEVTELDSAEKISPNQTPNGLDRISYKAEEHIKTISNVSDSMQGFDREDVAAKAIQAKRQAGATNLAKPLDALIRTDFILARNVLDIVQEYYTEERIITITKDRVTGETESFAVNEMTPEGEVANDLTLGEYSVVVGSTPVRESLEDTQFDQAVQLRELGVAIPDSVLIESSRLIRKAEILKQMQGDQESPEAQAQREREERAAEAEVSKLEAEAAQKGADAGLRQAKTQTEAAKAGDVSGMVAAQAAEEKARLERDKLMSDQQFQFQKLENERENDKAKLRLQAQTEAEKRLTERAAALLKAQQQPRAAQPA